MSQLLPQEPAPKGYKANFYKNTGTITLQRYKREKLVHKNVPSSCVVHVQRPGDTGALSVTLHPIP